LEGWSEFDLMLMLRRGVGADRNVAVTVWEWIKMVALALLISCMLTIPLAVWVFTR